VKRRSRAIAVVAIAAGMLCGCVLWVAWRAERALRGSERTINLEKNLAVHVSAIQKQSNPGFEAFSVPSIYSAAAFFEGSLYLSGPAGLYVYSLDGALEHVYRVGVDLPTAPLGVMASGTLADSSHPELLIATSGEGVIAFDGSRFRQIRPDAPDARNVTAILPVGSGGLLMGTAKRGVLEFDGRALKQFHPTASNLYVTALAGTESDVWIGTPNQGVLHWRGGQVEIVGENEGMPDVHVESLALDGEVVYAGTPNGVAEIRAGKVARVLARGRFARAIQPDSDSLLLGEFGGAITAIPRNGGREPLSRRPIVSPGGRDSNESAAGVKHDPVQQFFATGDSRYALTASTLLEQTAGGEWREILQGEAHRMTDQNVSALAVGGDGRLWVGYFDRGLDIFPATGGNPVHIENDQVFCVNRIVENATQGTVAVATANGLVLFDRDGHEKQVLTRDSGLIASHVTDVALDGNAMVAATPAGITFLDAEGPHSIYAFQGLVNNHVYALAAKRDALLVGTLGGLSVVSGGVVRRNLTTGNSGLKANWITALTPLGDDWLIGTYGAGIVRMDAEGNISSTEATRSGTVVNPGAMISAGGEMLAGTLNNGLLVGDSTGTRWKSVTAGLPSLNVTALAVQDGVVYVGTDNGLLKIAAGRL
jgi:ligand-binding sensor domain-containing protein